VFHAFDTICKIMYLLSDTREQSLTKARQHQRCRVLQKSIL